MEFFQKVPRHTPKQETITEFDSSAAEQNPPYQRHYVRYIFDFVVALDGSAECKRRDARYSQL